MSNNKRRVSKTTGVNIGEDSDKCCFAVDLKDGVTLIGILIVVYAAYAAVGIVNIFGSSYADAGFKIISCVILAPIVISGFYFV